MSFFLRSFRVFAGFLSPRRWLFRCLNIEQIATELDKIRIKRCFESTQSGEKSQFYAQAEIHNLASDRSKINVGSNTHIRGELLIFPYGGQITIGSDSYIGKGTTIWSASHVRIGNHVLISHNCNIIDTNSHEIDHLARARGFQELLLNGHPKQRPDVISAPIIIEDHAWISFNVSILKGVKIGKAAIVAAGAVVTKDVKPFSVVAGNPAKVIRKLAPTSK